MPATNEFTTTRSELLTEQLDMAWNEWIHGNEIRAAEIWYFVRGQAEDSQDRFSEIDALTNLAMFQRVWEGKNFSNKQIDLNRNLDNARALHYHKGIVNALLELAQSTNLPEIAQASFKEAREIAETQLTEGEKKKILKNVIFRHGRRAIQRGESRFDSIFKEFQKALEYAIEENDKYYIAQIHHGIGECFLRLGNLKEARRNYEIALQIFEYLGNERKILEVLVSITDVESQLVSLSDEGEKPIDVLAKYYGDFETLLKANENKIPLSDRFEHLSRFCDLFLELGDLDQVTILISELERILRQANIESSQSFDFKSLPWGRMAIAGDKGNLELTKLNLARAEELYNYILRRKNRARISDLYGALISLAIISIYRYRIYFDITFLSTAQDLIEEAIQITKDTDHLRGYVRASMVSAMLKITLEGETDFSEIEQVLETAQKEGLHIEARRAQEEINRFNRVARLRHDNRTKDRSVAEVLYYALEAKKIVRKA
ncbi:MAG: tetratricopeptide repeat protein [Candidatus Thorarchaeota archaeon]